MEYNSELGSVAANYLPLTPLSFLARAARVYPDKVAVVYGPGRTTYAELLRRCRRLASALQRAGVRSGDTVAVLAPNVPALLEAHFAVPLAGAVLNAINTRLDAAAIGFILEHGGAKVLLADTEFARLVRQALDGKARKPLVIDVEDPLGPGTERIGGVEYEAFVRSGDADFAGCYPQTEWQSISLNYTSGTTGNPRAALYSHRSAYLNAVANALALGLSARSVYLWTLPMFHCNGWTHPWAVTLTGGTHVCLRRLDPSGVFAHIREHGVTHMAGAPVVLNTLIHAQFVGRLPTAQPVEIATGGAAPPSAVIEAMERLGFRVTHLYGLTETNGPAALCEWRSEWDALAGEARSRKMARQGVGHALTEQVAVLDPATLQPVPSDGRTLGEIMIRSNTLMKGYLRNPAATAEAFAGGWFHTGDLAVLHPDGYLEVKDRAKDVIISGGENVASLEVEELLYRHPQIMEAAVVAMPHPHWGESPCAFVCLKPGVGPVSEQAIIEWCRERLAHFKCPRRIVFGALPKTATGKIQKFRLRERASQLAASGQPDQ